ncbi:MAG TPA: class I SAM-dependent methyltransferase [Pyrinomonadaceae bacterium]|nr:class I SAM-dependent methyltransferase [Pyrinomonadaceae bacterium]
MFVHQLAKFARKRMPPSIFAGLRRVATALFTPIAFSYQTGHFRSSLKAKALDNFGKPLPWYTYPAIDFLRNKQTLGKSVLEFGAGQSTLWWAQRVQRVVAIEDNESWFAHLLGRVPTNVQLILTDRDASNLETLNESAFDLIVVDGLNRFLCAQKAIPLLNEGGAIILDNSEGSWGPNGEYPIIDLFRAKGFSRIDFYGYAPGVILPACTSFFFKNDCFLLCGSENPARMVH